MNEHYYVKRTGIQRQITLLSERRSHEVADSEQGYVYLLSRLISVYGGNGGRCHGCGELFYRKVKGQGNNHSKKIIGNGDASLCDNCQGVNEIKRDRRRAYAREYAKVRRCTQ